MTRQLIKETAATTEHRPETNENVSTAGSFESFPSVFQKPGMLIAGAVLSAVLAAGTAGVMPAAGYYSRRRHHETISETETASVECDPVLLEEIRELFERGASEFFEDGMYSAFSRKLLAVIAQHGRMALQGIGDYVFSGVANPDVVSEALRWLADIKDPATLVDRWAILQSTLQHQSPRVRDGAILGFGALDDAHALPLLAEAKKKEQVPELRRLIDQVLEQLTNTDVPAPPQR